MRYGSLFSGTGALDMGVQSVLGGTTAWHSDVEQGPSRILAHHWPDVPNIGDITAVDWSAVEPVDVITGGYPCQPFSHAGTRLGVEDPRHLWPHVVLAVDALRPALCVFENVRGHLSLGFDVVLRDLALLGYTVRWHVLRASDVGAPHGRARLFIFAEDAHDQRVFGRADRRGGVHRDTSLRWLLAGAAQGFHDGQGHVRDAGDAEDARREDLRPATPAELAGQGELHLDVDRLGRHGADPGVAAAAAGEGGAGADRAGVPADGRCVTSSSERTRIVDAGDARAGGDADRTDSGGESSRPGPCPADSANVADAAGRVPVGLVVGAERDAVRAGGVGRPHAPLRDGAVGSPVRTADPRNTPTAGGFAWPTAADADDAAEHGQRARSRPGQRGAGAAADAGSLGWVGGPGVGRAGRDQAERGEEVRHPGDVHRAPAAAADPDSLGPHGAGDARGRGAGPADGSVAAARLFPTPRASDGTKGGPNQRGSSGDLMLPSAVALLPTPAVNDMGSSYTPATWDAWTGKMRARHGNGNGHGASLAIEAQRHAQDWGIYEPAIRRWEQVLGRAAPSPTRTGAKGNPQLSAEFSEFLMGLPAGWVTGPAIGLTRVQQLRALGNGVVWQQCALATRLWLAWACEQARA